MAKGKKTVITEIKKISDNVVSVNGKEYVLLEDVDDVETATTMKISSNGHRILRFEDEKKKARIDVKRDINIVKYTFSDLERAQKFKKGYDKSLLTKEDKKELITKTNCHVNAKLVTSSYTTKGSDNFDKNAGVTTFYLSQEVNPTA